MPIDYYLCRTDTKTTFDLGWDGMNLIDSLDSTSEVLMPKDLATLSIYGDPHEYIRKALVVTPAQSKDDVRILVEFWLGEEGTAEVEKLTEALWAFQSGAPRGSLVLDNTAADAPGFWYCHGFEPVGSAYTNDDLKHAKAWAKDCRERWP